MKKKQILLFALCMLMYASGSYAQAGLVNINTVTGAPVVSIPIDVVRRGNVAVPVSLTYSNSGIRPKDVEMNAGIGWQVQTGGQISRLVRGLPDDCKKDLANVSMLGWIYNTNQSAINGFNIINNGSNCTYETTDLSYINGHFSYYSDTEPDIFNVSAPGLSCQLVWDQSLSTPAFRTINYQDLVITPTFNASGALTSFTIVNDKGITYVFSSPETIKQTTVIASGATVNYFKSTYNQYKNGISYYNNWHLVSVTDQNGNGVNITYTTASTSRNSTDSVIMRVAASGTATTRLPQYSIKQTVTPQTLATISEVDSGDGNVAILTFTWGTSATGQTIISGISGVGKTFNFIYSVVNYNSNLYSRSFLRRFYTDGCSSPINYNFAYVGETVSNGNYSTTLSDSTTRNMDYWGYFNSNSNPDLNPALNVNPSNGNNPRYTINVSATVGSDYTNSLSGTNRSATPATVMAGSLAKVYYATGGYTVITYESNDYLDIPSNTTIQGGGVRVKQIIDSAVSSTVALTRTYSYKTSTAGNAPSSGKPVSLPQFAFTTPYNGTATGDAFWNYSTVRSESDLSPEDHSIMYEYVRETKTGAGSTLYQYYLPAMQWNNSATPACSGCSADWAPTINYVGRTNCSYTYGAVKNYSASYPFAPNINYDFERGLPLKVSNFNDSGLEISESNYTYQRVTATPAIIPALNFDDNVNGTLTVTGYSKYAIYASEGELVGTQIDKIFDSAGGTAFQSTTTTNYYNTAQHKLIKQTATNSDGSVITSNIKYVKDYTETGSNADVTAITNMKLKNMNFPIETYQQVTRGSTTKTISGSLSRYQATSINGGTSYMLSQQLKFISPDGDPSFTIYTPNNSSNVPQWYSGYTAIANYKTYDYMGNLATTDDAHKHIRTVITNSIVNAPEAIFTNANFNEIGFSDFDSYLPQGPVFSYSGSFSYLSDSHSGKAANMASGQNFSKTLTKNALANNYIFSIWMNAPSGSNTLTFTLTGGATSTYTKSYTGTGTWKYYQFTIPVANMSSSFSVAVANSVTASADDLIFYPENSEVTTFTYDPITHYKISQTNTNGVSAYFTNDNWGRVLYAFDQDKNLIQRNTYITPSDLQNSAPPGIFYYGPTYSNTPITFANSGYNACTNSGISSSWNFGDGATATSSGSVNHTYSSAGTYTVTLTSTSPLFGTQTVTKSITVTTPPPPPTYTTLRYTDYTTSNGTITNVSFNNGVDPVINVSGSALNGYQLPKSSNSYTITVSISGGTQYNSSTGAGYGCVFTTAGCRDFDLHLTNTYAFLNVSPGTYFDFFTYTTNCANSGL